MWLRETSPWGKWSGRFPTRCPLFNWNSEYDCGCDNPSQPRNVEKKLGTLNIWPNFESLTCVHANDKPSTTVSSRRLVFLFCEQRDCVHLRRPPGSGSLAALCTLQAPASSTLCASCYVVCYFDVLLIFFRNAKKYEIITAFWLLQTHGSHNVSTWISYLNKRTKGNLGIRRWYARPPTAQAVEILSGRHQMDTGRPHPVIHVLTLPRWLEIGPRMNPVGNQRNNLHIGWVTLLVKK
jgi:hypothetical protein